MKRRMRIALALTAAGLAGGGVAAVAHGGDADPAAEQEAFLEDAAERLGVEPEELETALEEAALARVDAAREAGRLTEEQAAELKERIRSGQPLVPGFRFHGPGRDDMFHPPPFLDTAAEYLGLEVDAVRSRLADGESLAEVAEAEGKSVNGLVDALVAAARERFEDADPEELAGRIREHVTALVEGRVPDRPGPRHRWGDGDG